MNRPAKARTDTVSRRLPQGVGEVTTRYEDFVNVFCLYILPKGEKLFL
jgi:hypothetical protein